MGTKVREIPQGLALRPCDPVRGGCCSMHRRADRVYEDQVWELGKRLGPGHRLFDPTCP